jgi:hypothetical protein
MSRNIRTARGEIVDFDAIIIKHQLAQAPMNIEVARRKEFIDSKEGKVRGAKKTVAVEVPAAPVVEIPLTTPEAPTTKKK